MVFKKSNEKGNAAKIADFKIFYTKVGRYRALKVDEHIDGSCIGNVPPYTGKMENGITDLTIEMGKRICERDGFAYAALKDGGQIFYTK